MIVNNDVNEKERKSTINNCMVFIYHLHNSSIDRSVYLLSIAVKNSFRHYDIHLRFY